MSKLILGLGCLVVLVLATSVPLFFDGFFPIHDFTHGARIAEMTRALRDGHIPVRWSQNFGYGYGMPLFQFYGPLPFFVGSLFVLSGISLLVSVKTLFFLANIGTVMGGFKLGQSIAGTWAGIATASIISLFPYRAVNMYVRGAVSEAWGIMFLVWFVWAITLAILHNSRKAWIFVALSLSGMVLSHNLTALMAGIATVMCIITWVIFYRFFITQNWQHCLQRVGQIVLGGVVGGGITAFYIIPAVLEKHFTKIDGFVLSSYFDYKLHFLYIRQFFNPTWGYGGSEWGPDDKMSFFLGWPQISILLIAAIVTTVFLMRGKFKSITLDLKLHTPKHILLPGFVTVAFALLSTLAHSSTLWNMLPFLQYLQFPWRWLSVVTVYMGVITASIWPFWITQKNQVLLALGVVLISIGLNAQYFRSNPEGWLDQPDSLYYHDSQRIQTHMSEILPDYIPTTLQLEQINDRLQPLILPVTRTQFFPQDVIYEVQLDRTTEFLTTVELTKPTTLMLAIAYFPGWQVEVDGIALPTHPNQYGLLTAQVPAGTHVVGAYFAATPIRSIANSISLLACMVLLGGVMYYEKARSLP